MTFDNYTQLIGTPRTPDRAEELADPRPRLGHAGHGVHGDRGLDRRPLEDPRAQVLDRLASCRWSSPGWCWVWHLSFVYLRSPIPIYGTLLILLIAYCTRYMPYGMRYAATSMQQISSELEESAQVSGASWWQTFRRVLLPLLSPGLIAGWIYILVVSFRELSSSILLYSPGNEVLSILIWEQFENGQFTVLAALGVVMVLTLVVLVTVAYKLGAKVGLKQD